MILRISILLFGVYLLSACASPQTEKDIAEKLSAKPGIQMIEVDGVNVRYRKTGQGEPLVLIHHVRGQLEYFDKIAPALSENFTVYAVDLPGHGGSDLPDIEYTAQSSLAAAKGFIQTMQLDDVSLLGESIGGSLVLALAADDELTVKKVIAMNAFDGVNGISNGSRFAKTWVSLVRTPGIGAIVSRLQRKGPFRKILAGGFHDPANLDQNLVDLYFETGMRNGMSKVLRSFLTNSSSYVTLSESFKGIKVPVLSIRGESDWMPASEREPYVAAVPGVKQVTLDNAGHFSSQEVPDLVVQHVLDFL